jgi:small-conductance mechanosensitive channel
MKNYLITLFKPLNEVRKNNPNEFWEGIVFIPLFFVLIIAVLLILKVAQTTI